MTAEAGPPRGGVWPRISIVTPSLNQGAFIERTIRSVLEQGYPDLEHIVVDGLSTDGTAETLARHPHLIVIREADGGQGEAINKGFARASGAILGFLNADDTLEPGTLFDVARRLDAGAGRHVVMGRCRFIDADDRFTGIEHPSAFAGHERVLAIWRGHWLPQPAIFWTRAAWERAGPLDAGEHLVLDYDLFCRMSRHFAFEPVDRVYANYRLHEASKTVGADDATRLERSIRVSRRYWGPWWSALRWRLTLSLLVHRIDRAGRGCRLLRRADAAWRAGARGRALGLGLAGAALAPDVAFFAMLYPPLRRRLGEAVKALIRRRAAVGGGGEPPSPQTLAHMANTGVWHDGWAGPRLILAASPSGGGWRLRGRADLAFLTGPLRLTARVMDGPPLERVLETDGDFEIELPGGGPAGPGGVVIEVTADRFFVPHRFRANHDHRALSWRFTGLEPRP